MPDPAQRREEVAARLGVSTKTLRRIEAAHAIPVLRFRNVIRYDATATKTRVDARKQQT